MKLEKFVIKALRKGVVFDNMAHGMSFRQYGKLADLTKHVKYNCDFNSEGRCSHYRDNRHLAHDPQRPTMCCCHGCYNSMGYLYSLPTSGFETFRGKGLADLKLYARLFSENTIAMHNYKIKVGFWRPGKGCILPRAYRSTTCLSYACGRSSKFTPWEKRLFRLLGRKPKFPVTIRGKKYMGFDVAKGMGEWYEEINDKNNSK